MQRAYPQDYFRSPLDIRLLLSGTFGEIRSNHFHSGIDIKTGGAEGAPVYAIADGYVSRIKVSAYGFGKALYVTHPNGFVSVYGHISRYNEKIGNHIRNEQYRQESFEIELFPGAQDFPVRKGEIIAYSGNSGSSGGPHLHFEIRDEGTQKPINPLLFGYDVKDLVKPKITSIKIYPADEDSKVNGANQADRYLAESLGTEYRLAGNAQPRLSGNISFAIQVFDQQNDTDNKNGPYSVRLLIDDNEVFSHRMETFTFDETRYVNSLIDYEEYVRNNVRLQRTRIDPGNKLDIYGNVRDRGVFQFCDTMVHTIRYEVSDVPGNKAVLSFKIKAESPSSFNISTDGTVDTGLRPKTKDFFEFSSANHFEAPSLILDAPAGCFYDSFTFSYDSVKRIPGTYSAVHRVHNKYTPVHDYLTLSLKTSGLPERLFSKAMIVKVKDDGRTYEYAGGKYDENGLVTARVKEFGNFCVAVDTLAPTIIPVNPDTFKALSTGKSIKFTVRDEMSGIARYRGTLNGKWILMDYDPKNDLLVYKIDERLIPGENNFSLEVVDNKNNRKIYETRMAR